MRLASVLLLAAACGGHASEIAPVEPAPLGAAEGPGAGLVAAHAPAEPAGPTPPALRLDGSVVPTEYLVDLTLDPAKPDFTGSIAISADFKQATQLVWLHGKELTIASATIAADHEVAATATAHGEFLALALAEPVGPGKATIKLAYTGKLPLGTAENAGLFRQSEGGHTYLYSQFEATEARRAFPCFDEPSFKVPWQLTLHVPKGMVALSNTLPAHEADDGDLHTIVFGKTQPLPSYLVALAVGPFDLVDLGKAGKGKIPMRIAVPKGRAADARYAKQVSAQLVAGLERYLDTPYPYAKLDQVAIPTFLGAMENPGLITYSESILLARPNEETFEWKHGCASTAAHEMAHQWFGDLVTMKWWDDIWLNEAFADFMADRVLDDWQPTWGVAMHRLQEAQGAFAADALVSARKIHNPITTANDVLGAFDSITYAKGGAVLAMFEAWVGRKVFQKVLHDYLAAHAWGNASFQDFIDALAAASKPEVSTAFDSFLDQGGIPLVSLDLACTGGKDTLQLAQERFLPIGSTGSTAQTWSIPMCVSFPKVKIMARNELPEATQCFLFSDQAQTVALDAPGCPAWVDGNPGGRGYYRVRYAGTLGKQLLAAKAIDSVSRAAGLFNLRAMVDGGYLKMGDLLAVIPDVAKDKSLDLVTVALELATGIEPYVDDAQRASYAQFLGKSFAGPARALGWKPKPGEAARAATLRPQLLGAAALLAGDPKLIAEARKLAAAYVTRPTTMDPQLGAIAIGAATHAGDDALAGRLDAAFSKSEDHNLRAALLAGMAVAHDPAVRAKAFARLGDGSLTTEEIITLIRTAATDPTSKAEVYAYVTAHLDAVIAALPFLVRPYAVGFAALYCDEAHRQALDTTFAPKIKDLPGGEKATKETAEAMDLCLAQRKAVGADVAAFLSAP